MRIEDFSSKRPSLRFEEFFLGRSRAWGIFEDRFGNLRRELTIDMIGDYENDVFILDERFHYADGERQERRWSVRVLSDGAYAATAHDVIGTASGMACGNAMRWRYRVGLSIGGRTWPVSFDDWMFLQPDGVVVNRATVRYHGIRIGTVSMFIQGAGAEGSAQVS